MSEVMKHAILSILILASAVTARGQWAVNFSNIGRTPVTNCLTGAPVVVGTTFLVALYFASDGMTDETQLIPAGAPVGFGSIAGIFSGGARTTTISSPGAFGMFQLRVWESSFGTSYEAAINAAPDALLGRSALRGKSEILRVETYDPTVFVNPAPEPPDFSPIVLIAPDAPCIPEPSIGVLLVLGAPVVGLIARRGPLS